MIYNYVIGDLLPRDLNISAELYLDLESDLIMDQDFARYLGQTLFTPLYQDINRELDTVIALELHGILSQ
jgi:hypothetical protein